MDCGTKLFQSTNNDNVFIFPLLHFAKGTPGFLYYYDDEDINKPHVALP